MTQPAKIPMLRRKCPICGKPAVYEERPFCSSRCKDVDLNRWLKGSYAIPAAPSAEDEDEVAALLEPGHDKP